MIWIILLYVLPFFICCYLGYKESKKEGDTKLEYLLGVLLVLIPLLNIIVAFALISESNLYKQIKKYLNSPL